ncbi:MAG: hypothetical protein ACLSFZ_03520 [Frisingicoccus sp.]
MKKIDNHRFGLGGNRYYCCVGDYQSPKWSRLSFEAIVQKTITQPDGEVRLSVEDNRNI